MHSTKPKINNFLLLMPSLSDQELVWLHSFITHPDAMTVPVDRPKYIKTMFANAKQTYANIVTYRREGNGTSFQNEFNVFTEKVRRYVEKNC